jgi:hypothetical protein
VGNKALAHLGYDAEKLTAEHNQWLGDSSIIKPLLFGSSTE